MADTFDRKEGKLIKLADLPALNINADGLILARKGYMKAVPHASFGFRYEQSEDIKAADIDGETAVLDPGFIKVPMDLWIPWVSLCFKYLKPHIETVKDAPDSTSEVSCILARRAVNGRIVANDTEPGHWRILIPRQTVGAGSVDADLTDLVDLVTGEVLKGLPEDWCHWGSSHSHNTMGAFFSGTDDANELGRPGLHVVVGELSELEDGRRTYKPKASIVYRGKRYIADAWDLIERWDGRQVRNYHPKCLEYVTKYVPKYERKSSILDGIDFGDLDTDRYPILSAYFNAQRRREAEEKLRAAKDDVVTSDKQHWLNTPGARLSKGSDKLAPVIPIGIRLAIESSRKDAGKMDNSHLANCIRQVCNGLERFHTGSAKPEDMRQARRILFELVSDVAMWTAED